MDIVLGHFQDFWIWYAAAAAVLIPMVFFTRRYSVPVLLWAVEYVVYCGLFHIVMHFFVMLVVWFKLETTPHYKDKIDPGWQTPLLAFWERAEYEPVWIFYVEIVFLILLLGLMIRIRPMKVQKFRKREMSKGGKVPAHLVRRYGPGGNAARESTPRKR